MMQASERNNNENNKLMNELSVSRDSLNNKIKNEGILNDTINSLQEQLSESNQKVSQASAEVSRVTEDNNTLNNELRLLRVRESEYTEKIKSMLVTLELNKKTASTCTDKLYALELEILKYKKEDDD